MKFDNISRAVIEPNRAVIYNGTSSNGVTSGGIYTIRIVAANNSVNVWVYEGNSKQCVAIMPFVEQHWYGLTL